MKTASKSTIEKKLAKLVSEKRISKSSLIYGWVNQILTGQKLFRPFFSQGSSWKYSSLQDHSAKFQSILTQIGVEFKTGNDAPKGGKTGYFVEIITKIK